MLKIFICEDFITERDSIKRYIEDFLTRGNYDMEMGMVTGDPEEVIDYLKGI